jgi:hypothetical protein
MRARAICSARSFLSFYFKKHIDKSVFFAILTGVSGESYSPKTNECPRELRRKADFAYLALSLFCFVKKAFLVRVTEGVLFVSIRG